MFGKNLEYTTEVHLDNDTYKKRSDLWYGLPILIGIIGGLVAYFIIKNDESIKAKYCLIIGGVVTVIGLVINWMISAKVMGI
ncbi:MAG: hypothetical protein COY74_03060 [Nitrosopumilales archaeon CG_4_10_14_0_8_um_filter_34_8]|nr:MAG: hypothetical protein COY74_03060 [Nitrosopumilales archaeon CG_4_10_14_0_8_um_filter_34_8]